MLTNSALDPFASGRHIYVPFSRPFIFSGVFKLKKESKFQAELIKELKERYPGCEILKNDPNYKQGFPDLTIFYNDRWAVLECKRSENESHQPNQDYYVEKLNRMSYSSFIFPENKEKVLNELEQTLKSGRKPRVSKCKQVQLADEDK